MLDRIKTIVAELAPAGGTPTLDELPRRIADFETLGDALDYAGRGKRGMNFHDARGQLVLGYPYAQLREDALGHAQRFLAKGLKAGDRLALIAETGPEFAACFFGAVYAGLWPVPLPLPTSFGGREAYVEQLRVMLGSSDPVLFLCPPDLLTYAEEAAAGRRIEALDWDSFGAIEGGAAELPAADADEVCYLQYSSGSTRFPHGVAVTHRQLLSNLRAHGVGLQVKDTDRCVSWLPWYHDMGLVGCMLSPMSLQMSVDYMKTEDFARRPLAWLDIITRNPGTSVSYSPTFGYDICARRMSSQTRAEDRFDLRRWRIAGNGADMIRPDVMQAFVDAFADAGFQASAFCPSYGEWDWVQARPPAISMGWYPEKGFHTYDWRGYNEGAMVILLALGSPTHPVDPAAWPEWTKTYQWGSFYGQEHVLFAPLFGHQYTQMFIDFRGIQDAYMRAKGIDYFENSRRATMAQRSYTIENPGHWKDYGPNIWGLTACDGPGDATVGGRTYHSYTARGATAGDIRDDGTIAPTAAASSIAFTPDISIAAIEAMEKYPGVYRQYGFADAFNPTFNNGWVDVDYLGIDQGPIIAMIENYRSGLVWNTMKKNAHIVQGLKRAGFTGGWLETQ